MQAQEPADLALGSHGPSAARDQAFAARKHRITVREYAHTLRPNWTEGSRADFAETVYWNAGVKTDASPVSPLSRSI